MKPYKNLQGGSGVRAYEAGDDYIRVAFAGGDVYLYTEAVTGREHIRRMKRLAQQGQGLSTYISRYVRDRYAEKSR